MSNYPGQRSGRRSQANNPHGSFPRGNTSRDQASYADPTPAKFATGTNSTTARMHQPLIQRSSGATPVSRHLSQHEYEDTFSTYQPPTSSLIPSSTRTFSSNQEIYSYNHTVRGAAGSTATQPAVHSLSASTNPIRYFPSCMPSRCCCCPCIHSQEMGVLETFQEFDRVLGPGVTCIAWPIQQVSVVHLRIQQYTLECRDCKTRDNVFCHVQIVILYRVYPTRVYDAVYNAGTTSHSMGKNDHASTGTSTTANSRSNIQAFLDTHVHDLVRSTVSRLTFDQVYGGKLPEAVFEGLYLILLNRYGYQVSSVLLHRIVPDADQVRSSMNEVNAQRRMKDAAAHQAEGLYIQKVKQAEGLAESKYLQGLGTSRERAAILEGMRESLNHWMLNVKLQEMPSFDEAMHLVLVTQYMDVITQVGANEMFL